MVILESEIVKYLAPVIEVKKNKKLWKTKPESAGYFSGYMDFCDWREAISNHTVKGKKPVEMLKIKAPYQSQAELDYVVANFKQITLPVSFEFLTTIGRGLHDSNWSRSFTEDKPNYVNSDTTFKQYVEKQIASTPLQMNYDAWMKFVLPSVKINDSMGVIAVKPHKMEKTVEVGGEEVYAGDDLPEPIPYYYSCERVLNPLSYGYCLIETNNFSNVKIGSRIVREGLIFELYDEENIWIITQKGNKIDWEFDVTLYFKHDLGFLPVTYLMGIPDSFTVPGEMCWQSPFLMVTDILDEVLLDGCNLRSVKASCVYPQKAMLGNVCQFKDPESYNPCLGGYILNKDGQGFHKCPDCGGVGTMSRTGPTQTLLIKPKTSMEDGDNIKPTDAIAYISPSIDTPQFLREEINHGNMNAMSILHLKTTNTTVKGAEDLTATGMVMDEKGKYAFIGSVVNQIFDIDEFVIRCMGMMRYQKDFKMPEIQRPISYDFNSEGDYLVQISAAQAAGAPPVVIASYVYKYLKAIFYDNPNTAKAYDLIIAADRLFIMTKDQIMSELSRNLVEPYEVVLHDSALTFISELQRETPNFLEQEMNVMIEQLVAKAKENTPTAPVAAKLNPTNILANANAA